MQNINTMRYLVQGIHVTGIWIFVYVVLLIGYMRVYAIIHNSLHYILCHDIDIVCNHTKHAKTTNDIGNVVRQVDMMYLLESFPLETIIKFNGWMYGNDWLLSLLNYRIWQFMYALISSNLTGYVYASSCRSSYNPTPTKDNIMRYIHVCHYPRQTM